MMMPAWALPLLAWAKQHWKDLAAGAAVLLAFAYWRQAGELAACQAALAAQPPAVVQTQAVSATAKAQGHLVIRPGAPRPCPPLGECPPCPEIDFKFGAEAGVAAAQTQTVKPAPAAAAGLQRRVDLWLASNTVGDVSAGGRVDLVQFGPVILGAGLESPTGKFEPKALVSVGLPLAWPFK